MFNITLLPEGRRISAQAGANLLAVLRDAGCQPDAPCGGHGTCGKCKVLVDGVEALSCETAVDRDMTVTLLHAGKTNSLTTGMQTDTQADGTDPYVLAYDIGTTTVVCYLLDGHTGAALAQSSCVNPQTQYGADVISRIQYAKGGGAEELRKCICDALSALAVEAAGQAGIRPEEITLASVVGNTAMHHLLLGIDTDPLVTPPYMPAVRDALEVAAKGILPISPAGALRVLPNIAGFVGADTVACMAATRFDRIQALTLLIDIGTNGEMVLGDSTRRIACSTAAGPAFEGAKISCGMRGAVGAVDHVFTENGQLGYHTIGDAEAEGLCGSGLLDLVAVLLEEGVINPGGKMSPKTCQLGTSRVSLTQKDVREVQLAKSAIRSGIELLAKKMGVQVCDIQQVYLAGAFGNYMDPVSACRIGMIPPVLLHRITPIGNAAGEGAKRCALSAAEYAYSKRLAAETEFLELASMSEFQDCYVDNLLFEEDDA